MVLVDIYTIDRDEAARVLYEILQERKPIECIRHNVMPSFEQHLEYIASVPYRHWFLMEYEGGYVGHINLSRDRKVGVFVLKDHRGHGHGTNAMNILMRQYPGIYYAEINPENYASKAFFKQWESHKIQETYELF